MKNLFLKNKIKHYKKFLFWIGGILFFLIALNIGINQWIKSELPSIIKEKNDTAYDFEFEGLSFSLLNSSISLEKVLIKPKKNYPKPIPLKFIAKVGEIKVVGVNFIKLLSKKDLSAYSLKINEPDITYIQPIQKDTVQHNSRLGNIIQISNFEINDGKFTMFSHQIKKIASIKDINIELGGVNLSQRTLEKDIPFTYTSFELDCDSIFFQINPSQQLDAGRLRVNDNLFVLKNFKINSNKNIAKLNPEKINYRLLPDIIAPNVSFTGLDWGYNRKDEFYFNANILKFDSIDVNIKNDKEVPDQKRDSLGYLIPFKLDIHKILVDNSKLKIGNSLSAQDINIQISKIKNELNKKLSVESILLNHPSITTFSGITKSKVEKAAASTDFKDFIEIKSLKIKDGKYRLNKLSNNQNLLKVNDINFNMEDIRMTPETFFEQIPITYKNVTLTASSLDYNPNHIYSLKTKSINYENGNFSLNQFEMKPKISRAQFVRQLSKEKDLYTISAKKIDVQNMDWGFTGKDMYFKIPNINIQTADANIYRSKIPPDDPKKKLLYSKLLRDLPFILEVKHVNLKNSKVEYEEETATSNGAGKLIFSNFNASIDNIYSGYKKSVLPDVKADIKTSFMNDSRLVAIWTFNPMNRSEKFNIKGSIFSFDAKRMTPFIKPYIHVTAEGNMKEIRFNFTGNDVNASGDFGIKYDNLKVTLYNENGKERKILSAVGNIFVKSNTKDQYKEERIQTVTRNQDRSFFNFFWHCVQQGLKQTLLII